MRGQSANEQKKNLGRRWLGSYGGGIVREIQVLTEERRMKRSGPYGEGHVRVWSRKVPRSAA